MFICVHSDNEKGWIQFLSFSSHHAHDDQVGK